MAWLTLSFFVTACAYASVGFGGGSTYNALLVLAKVDYTALPLIALSCNLIVVTGGTFRFARAGHVHIKKIIPWIITSVPAAWLGGYVEISEFIFIGLLGLSLLVSGLYLFYSAFHPPNTEKSWIHSHPAFAPIIGAFLGAIAGMVGIGGGIFLAPILHLLRWDNAKSIAATCSIFILVNSLAGLVGQVMKIDTQVLTDTFIHYWMIFPIVLFGGQIGSYMGAVRLDQNTVRIITALLTLYVSCRLLWRWFELFITTTPI